MDNRLSASAPPATSALPDGSEPKYPAALLSCAVWGIAALFYLTGFYQRVSPAVMTTELMRDLRIGAADLGNLSAFYFYVYVAMQIPTGVLIDSWGARRLLIWGSLLAAAGTFLFGLTSSYAVACVGRAIIGGGTAVGWVVSLKLATHWFPARRFALLSGFGLFFGNVGALAAQVPLRLLIERFGWRSVVLASSGIIFGVTILAWTIVRTDPVEKGLLSYAHSSVRQQGALKASTLLRGFRSIFAYRNTWLIFFAQGGMVGPVLAFTGLWGTPYLRARFGVPTTTAAGICSIMTICWATASPISGYLSDRIGRRKPIYLWGCLVSTLGWIVLFYIRSLPLAVFVPVAAVTSLACGAVILGFAYSKESVPVQFLGAISGATNIGNMIGPMLLQPAIGWVLDKQSSGQAANGVRVYGENAFQSGFLLIVAWAILACMLISFTKETRCKQSV